MVAAVSDTINPKAGDQNPKRPPLLPSEPDNALNPRRPKSREVVSRYLSTSSSSTSSSSSLSSSASGKRCPSPSVSRNSRTTPMPAVPSAIKRSQSVERRRTATPRPNSPDLRTPRPNSPNLRTPRPNSPNLRSKSNGELTEAQKLLLKSTRSLSVSFQGQSFSMQTSKAKPAPSPNVSRKGTPERRKQTVTTPARGGDQTENSKVERWPGSLRRANSMSRSVDCTEERTKLGRSGGSNVVRALQNSMIDNRPPQQSRLSSAPMNFDKQKKEESVAQIAASNSQYDQQSRLASDTESVSSGSASVAQESSYSGNREGKSGGQGIIIPARFWQETNNRLRRQSDPPGSPVHKKTPAPAKFIAPKKFGLESPGSSPKGVVNSRGLSPIRGAARPASPSKLVPSSASSLLRGMSPSRVRNGVISGSSCNLGSSQSFLGFAADVKKGKIGESRVFDAHVLRLFHSRLLQWRFINARADSAHYVQRITAEESLYNAWISTSRLRESVKAKRSELQLLRENLKLMSILKGQMAYLEEWALLDGIFSSSLSGATEALRASTLRLPVVGGARADVRKLNDAICSAVNVMQAMASSVCSLMSKVEEVNSLLADLQNVGSNECALLNQSKDLLSSIAAMQVTECSLRTHIIQSQHLPPNLTTQM